MKKKFNIIIVVAAIGFFGTLLPQNNLVAQACSGLSSITLTVVAAPQPTLNAPGQLCPGANGTIAVNQTFSTYAWNIGGSGQSIPINNPGTYTVTVSNAAGCTATATANVAAAPVPAPNITQNTYTCNGQIVLNAGAGFTTYAWNNSGGTTQTATYASGGTYTVTVTNSQGCTGTDDFNVTIPTPPVVSITGDLIICTGGNTTLNATPGFSTYAWSGGGSSANLPVTTGGTFTVTATDASGCTDTESATVVAEPSPAPTVANADICPGATVTLSVSNAPFQSYSWNTGGSTSTTTVNAPGTYTVTVTAVNGCTGTTTANVALLPVPNPNISQANYTCNGQLILNAGAGFVTYLWSNSAGTQTTTVTTSGNYTVTVSNVQGCTATDTFFANIPAPPVVSITGDNNFCQGTFADLNAMPGFTSYSWTGGQTGPNLTVTVSGTFTVTVTDAFGCTATNNFTVAEQPSPQPVIAGPANVCAGTNATFSTATGFPTYSWSNSQTTPTITVTTAGTYTVTVTAANGCTGTDTQTLNLLTAPAPTISQAPYACDDQLTLNAGPGFTAYAWSTAINAQFSIVNSSGIYTVTVTNAQGCTGTDTYLANIPVPPFVDITGNNTLCPGSSTTLTSTPGYSNYLWSTTSNNPNIPVSTSGNYTVTVTDAFGCTTTDEFSVSALNAPVPNISGPSQICATGNATFSVPGAFSTFVWSTSATTPTITVNTANTYTVTVTAANGCTGTDSQVLVVANSLQPQITELPYTCNGQITLDAGSGFASYNWSGSQNAQSITVSAGGTYTVTVSDAGGCTGTAVAVATIPAPPVMEILGASTICAGTSTALTATAGLSAYLWSTAQVGASINASAAGAYTVTATDALGCTVVDDFLLTNTPAPQPNITGSTLICTNSSTTLALSGTFNQYLWSTGATTPTIVISTGNNYAVTVTDALGCTGTDTQTVTEATGLSPVLSQLPYTCNGIQTLDAGAGFSTYAWSGGQATPTVSVTIAGTYSVTVTDANGCTGTGTLEVSIPTAPQVSISGKNSFCQNENTTLEATPGFATYLWSNGSNAPSSTLNSSGTITVTVTDNLGCTDTESIAVTAWVLPVAQIVGPAALCAGGSVTVSLSQNFAAYIWSNGINAAFSTFDAPGPYTVTVTDDNGCTDTDEATLTINQNPVPVLIEVPYACDGQVTLDAGAGFFKYMWSNGGLNAQFLIVNAASTYTVTVTDANTCTGTATVAVTVPTLNQVSVSGPTQFCKGGSVDLVASTGFVQYTWSSGPTLPNIIANTAGVYVVTATDALGCTSTAVETVGEFPSPAPTIGGPTTVCPGNTATLNVVGTYSAYLWSNGSIAADITVQPPFTATVTVTDPNGCTGVASASVVISNQLAPSIVQLPYACDGQITLDAGPGFSKYTWSNGVNAQFSMLNSPGTYTVTVSDGGGCSGTATIEVTLPVPPQVVLDGDTQLCPSETATLTATAGFSAYVWSNGSLLSTTNVSAAGTYSVTVTDALGCTGTATLAVQALAPPAPAITGPATICGSNSVTLSVTGGAFVGILWSNATGAPNIAVNAAGTYSVTVIAVNGCTGTAQATVVAGGSLTTTITQQPYACNGQITLDAGAGFATYSWSTGLNAQFSTLNTSGTYTVTVADAGGCTGTATIQATLPTTVPPQVYSVPSLCPGASITSIVTNQQNFVKFEWNTGETAPFLPGVVGGAAYTVTVTDANGCTQTAGFTIQLSPVPTPAVTQLPYKCDGQITLDAGPGFATYSWSTGVNAQFSMLNSPGTYTVTVTNNLACPGTGTAQVVIPAEPVAVITGATSFCKGSSTTLTASAGFVAYAWSTGLNAPFSMINSPGIYTVTVTDGNGCTATDTLTVNIGTPAATTVKRTSCRLNEAGTQTFLLTAVTGCDSVVTIITTYQPTKPGLALDSQPEIQAKIGQLIELNITGNFPIDSVAFQSPFPLSCSNCPDPSLTAGSSGFIQVTAFDAGGCQASEQIRILVSKMLDIYVPNIFLPGSGANGFFSVYSGPEIMSVRNFNVFDRWGNSLFSRTNLPTNDPSAGWDGTFRNQKMQPGVYVYYFEALLADGTVEGYSGDVTIVE